MAKTGNKILMAFGPGIKFDLTGRRRFVTADSKYLPKPDPFAIIGSSVCIFDIPGCGLVRVRRIDSIGDAGVRPMQSPAPPPESDPAPDSAQRTSAASPQRPPSRESGADTLFVMDFASGLAAGPLPPMGRVWLPAPWCALQRELSAGGATWPPARQGRRRAPPRAIGFGDGRSGAQRCRSARLIRHWSGSGGLYSLRLGSKREPERSRGLTTAWPPLLSTWV